MPTFKRLIPTGVRRFFYAIKSEKQLRIVPPEDSAHKRRYSHSDPIYKSVPKFSKKFNLFLNRPKFLISKLSLK